MIVVDTSAVVAIFRQHDDAQQHADRIGANDDPVVSAASLLEFSLVPHGLKDGAAGSGGGLAR